MMSLYLVNKLLIKRSEIVALISGGKGHSIVDPDIRTGYDRDAWSDWASPKNWTLLKLENQPDRLLGPHARDANSAGVLYPRELCGLNSL